MFWFFYRKPANFLVLIPSMLSGLNSILPDVVMGYVIDVVDSDKGMSRLKLIVICGFFAGVLASVCTSLNYGLWVVVGSDIAVKVKSTLFKSMMRQSVEFYDCTSIGEMLTLLNDDARCVERSFVSLKSHALKAFSHLVCSIVIALRYSYSLTGMMIVCGICVAFVQRLFRQFARKCTKKQRKASSKMLTIFEEAMAGARVVASFNRQGDEIERMDKFLRKSSECEGMSRWYYALCYIVSDLLTYGTMAIVLNVGSFQILNGTLTSGAMFALAKAALLVGKEINHLLSTGHMMEKGLDAADRIFKVLDSKPAKPRLVEMNNFTGQIEFRNVWFKYPTRDAYVLQGVSFVVNPMDRVAFVGQSGSGKSTIVHLLLKFYEVTQGEILLDGVNIKDIDEHCVHRMFAVVQQDPTLFSSSLRDNIKYGFPEATDAMVIEAARIANADHFVKHLPDTYDHMINEKGLELSGGQRQRICIARAVLSNPCVLISDEATSALDTENENEVMTALEQVMCGKTSITIAHRLATVRHCLTIYVLEAGIIREHGNHAELVRLRGRYYTLLQEQLNP